MTRRSPAILAMLLAMLAPSWALAEIKGPDSVPVYQLATVTTDVEADGYIWLAFPLETTFAADQADPRVLQFTGTPGLHQVILIPLRDGKPAGQFRKTVIFGDPPPPPEPIPPPGPTPPPIPRGEVAHATLIYDESRLATARPEVRSGMAKLESEGKLAVNWHAYDDDQSGVTAGRYMDHVQMAGGLPALILQSKDGTVLGRYPCPPTVEGVMQLLKADATGRSR